MQTHNHYFKIKYHKRWKVHPEKNGFKVQSLIFHILFKIVFFLLKKHEPFGIKKSRRPFWNKQKWLDKIVCFNFLRKQNCAQDGVYPWKFICDTFYITIIHKNISRYLKMLLVYMIKKYCFLFSQWLQCWMPLLVICGGLTAADFCTSIF